MTVQRDMGSIEWRDGPLDYMDLHRSMVYTCTVKRREEAETSTFPCQLSEPITIHDT